MSLSYIFSVLCVPACILTAPPAAAQDTVRKTDEYLRINPEGPLVGMVPVSGEFDARSGGSELSGPGMVYVEGLITPDGSTSVKLFRIVADSLGADHLKSDALTRMYEGYSGRNARRDRGEAPAALSVTDRRAPFLHAGFPGDAFRARDTVVAPDSAGTIVAVYAIQVGAFSVAENAVKLSAFLRSKGFTSSVYDNLIDGRHLLHLVWAGRYDTREEALPGLKKIEELTGLRGVLRERMIWRRR